MFGSSLTNSRLGADSHGASACDIRNNHIWRLALRRIEAHCTYYDYRYFKAQLFFQVGQVHFPLRIP